MAGTSGMFTAGTTDMFTAGFSGGSRILKREVPVSPVAGALKKWGGGRG